MQFLLFAAVLDRIIEISSNVHSVAARVQNLIHALTDGVRHVGERRCRFIINTELLSLVWKYRIFTSAQITFHPSDCFFLSSVLENLLYLNLASFDWH